MNVTIGGPTPNPHTPNSYEVTITVMYGDGDGYEDIVVGPFIKDKNEPSLVNLLETIDNISRAFPHGRSGDNNYDDVEGFLAWFSDSLVNGAEELAERAPSLSYEKYASDVALAEKFTNIDSFWRYDPMSDYTSPCGYASSSIRYYDENKVEHSVHLS